jgi:hypothetical protein
MRHRAMALIAVMGLTVTLVGAGATGASAGEKLILVFAQLSGDQVVPGPGDPDGTAFARFTLSTHDREVCVFFDTHENVATPFTAAHVHNAPADAAGPVVITFWEDTPAGEDPFACASADKKLIKDMAENPDQYYVDLHNAEFPDGAIRGQLHR